MGSVFGAQVDNHNRYKAAAVHFDLSAPRVVDDHLNALVHKHRDPAKSIVGKIQNNERLSASTPAGRRRNKQTSIIATILLSCSCYFSQYYFTLPSIHPQVLLGICCDVPQHTCFTRTIHAWRTAHMHTR